MSPTLLKGQHGASWEKIGTKKFFLLFETSLEMVKPICNSSKVIKMGCTILCFIKGPWNTTKCF